MTVVNGDGLVGRVKTVGPSPRPSCSLDPESSVGVRLEGSMEVGFATGQGIGDDGRPRPAAARRRSPPSQRGDRLVTFGSQGDAPYVPGRPGRRGRPASRARPGSQTRTATVAPFVDFTALDLVGVVVEPPRKDPRDAVLPPRPTPTPQPHGDRHGHPRADDAAGG